MPRTCEILYIGVDEKGRKLPRLSGFGELPLLDTSRLSPSLARPVEKVLAMVVARKEIASTALSKMAGIYTWEPKQPLQLAQKIAIGGLAFGVAATAATYYLLSK